MDNIKSVFKAASPEKIRTSLFVLAMVAYAFSYISFPTAPDSYSSLSSFLGLMGALILVQASSYKLKEKELFFHTMIEKNTNSSPETALLLVAIPFTLVSLLFAFYIYSTIFTQRDYDQVTHLISMTGTIFLSMGFSLWDRWSFLRKKRKLQKNT